MGIRIITANRIKAFTLGLMLLAATLCVLLVNAKPAEAAFPGKNGRIAFGKDGDIWTMNSDGLGQANLTKTTLVEYEPHYSPDGTKLVFTKNLSINELNSDIYVMNADGSGVRNLTNNRSIDQSPAWSPDGEKIVFASDRATDSTIELFTMNADGSGVRQLTPSGTSAQSSAAWSPDGSKIAFNVVGQGGTAGGSGLFTINADGTGLTRLTDYAGFGVDPSPSWSPDGTKIAFVDFWFTDFNNTRMSVATMNVDGSGKTHLTNDPIESFGSSGVYHDVAWSPNGEKIAFVRETDTGTTIHTMNSDGSAKTKITSGRYIFSADWGVLVPDNTPPNTSITGGPSGISKGATARFLFASSEVGSNFQCSLDRGAFTSCASPTSYTSLKNGWHRFRVRAIDSAGNVDPTPAQRNWRVDTIKPSISGVFPKPNSRTSDVTPTISGTVRDNMTNIQKSNIKLYVSGKRIASSKFTYSARTDRFLYNSPRLSKGKKRVKVVARDNAGNIRSRAWYFTIR